LGVTFQVSSTKAAMALRWNFASAAAMATVSWTIPQQEFGEGIAAAHFMPRRATLWVLAYGSVRLEAVLPARVLIADLVEILAIEFEAEFEAVLAMVPGDIVDELSGVIFVFVRALGTIAEAAETISAEAHVRNAPGDRQAPG
jgi:hypothetical protein